MAGSGSPQRPPGGDKMAAGPGPVRAEPGEGQMPAPWGPRTGPPLLWGQSSGRGRDPRCDVAQPVPFLFAPWDAAPAEPQRSLTRPHRFLAFLPRQRRSTQTQGFRSVFACSTFPTTLLGLHAMYHLLSSIFFFSAAKASDLSLFVTPLTLQILHIHSCL